MLLEFDLSCVSLTAPTTVWLRFSSGTLPGQFKMTGLDRTCCTCTLRQVARMMSSTLKELWRDAQKLEPGVRRPSLQKCDVVLIGKKVEWATNSLADLVELVVRTTELVVGDVYERDSFEPIKCLRKSCQPISFFVEKVHELFSWSVAPWSGPILGSAKTIKP